MGGKKQKRATTLLPLRVLTARWRKCSGIPLMVKLDRTLACQLRQKKRWHKPERKTQTPHLPKPKQRRKLQVDRTSLGMTTSKRSPLVGKQLSEQLVKDAKFCRLECYVQRTAKPSPKMLTRHIRRTTHQNRR